MSNTKKDGCRELNTIDSCPSSQTICKENTIQPQATAKTVENNNRESTQEDQTQKDVSEVAKKPSLKSVGFEQDKHASTARPIDRNYQLTSLKERNNKDTSQKQFTK